VISRPIRVYADTSVYGGVFDDAFRDVSRRFFDEVKAGRFRLVVSPVVADEVARAPETVRALFQQVAPLAEHVAAVADAVRLQQAYVTAGIVGPASLSDALHVALATVHGCRLIVSWNFKHIVHFDKIPLYNGISQANGYGSIGIHSPAEVVELEEVAP
jgi:predicted nucleic acid-binding protein